MNESLSSLPGRLSSSCNPLLLGGTCPIVSGSPLPVTPGVLVPSSSRSMIADDAAIRAQIVYSRCPCEIPSRLDKYIEQSKYNV